MKNVLVQFHPKALKKYSLKLSKQKEKKELTEFILKNKNYQLVAYMFHYLLSFLIKAKGSTR